MQRDPLFTLQHWPTAFSQKQLSEIGPKSRYWPVHRSLDINAQQLH